MEEHYKIRDCKLLIWGEPNMVLLIFAQGGNEWTIKSYTI
jgi:hypothetical protein